MTVEELQRRVRWIAACAVLAAIGTYVVSRQQTKKYTATAAVQFKRSEPGRSVAALPSTLAITPRAQWAANIRLVRSGAIATPTAARLGQGLTPAEVNAAVVVGIPREWGLVHVSATSTSSERAKTIATEYARLLADEQQRRARAPFVTGIGREERKLAALSRRERRSGRGDALRSRVATRRFFEKLQSRAEVHAAPEPTAPSSPRLVRNAALGAAGGLLVAVLGIFLFEVWSRRRKISESLARRYNLPLLGIVPRSAALSRRSRPVGFHGSEPLSNGYEEAFQLIRTRLRYFKIDRDLRAMVVASARRGDGRTTVAQQLASAAARAGSVVLLLEADLRAPDLAKRLGLQSGPGLADVLIGEISLWSATQVLVLDGGRGEDAQACSLDVLVAGVPLPPNPGKLIKSQGMQAVLKAARSTYDLIVIDSPSVAAGPELFPLLGHVDGVILVVRGGRHVRHASAVRLRASLDAARAPMLGVIANCVRGKADDPMPGADRSDPQAAGSAPRGERDGDDLAWNGSSPDSSELAPPRPSSRFKRAAEGDGSQAEHETRETASH
jgi:capsular exopolysaccharide synthesis family protein